jgi:hypothetical protein
MSWFRVLSIALTAAALLSGASGCRTAGTGSLTREPSPLPLRTSDEAVELLSDHNRNAELIGSLQARPSIQMNNRIFAGKADGYLSFERPRNFKLEMAAVAGMSDVANIGSNAKEFWVWVKDSTEKAVYYCNYEDLDRSPLASSMQPDWITEAFGLKVISEEEAARMTVKPGTEPGTVLLSLSERTPRGDMLIKEMVLSESSHRIIEHRVLTGDRKSMLARARISDFKDYPLPARTDGDASALTKVYLPKNVVLDWAAEKLHLDVTLTGVHINPKFTEANRADLFVEPKFKSYPRRNLAESSGYATQKSPTSIRETMPAPVTTPRVKLSPPTSTDSASQSASDPVSLFAGMTAPRPVGVEQVIGPLIPTVDEPSAAFLDARPAWRNTVER